VVWISGLIPPHDEDVGGDAPGQETYIRLEFTKVLQEGMPSREDRFKLSDHPSSKLIRFMEPLMAAAAKVGHPIAEGDTGNPVMLLNMVMLYHDHQEEFGDGSGQTWSFPYVDQVFYDKKDPMPKDDDLEEVETINGIAYVVPKKFLPTRAVERARAVAAELGGTGGDSNNAGEGDSKPDPAETLRAILNDATCRLLATAADAGGSGLAGTALEGIVRAQHPGASNEAVMKAVELLPEVAARGKDATVGLDEAKQALG
jgi:hypothetical protein